MTSPNVKVDRSVKIKRRNTLPGPLHKIRHASSTVLLQKRRTITATATSVGGIHNNRGGGGGCTAATTARSTSSMLPHNNSQWHHLHQSKTNPYVGWFRHAPSLTTRPTTTKVSFPNIVSTSSSCCSSTLVNIDTLWLRDWLVDTKVFHQHKKRRIGVNVKDHTFTQYKYRQQDTFMSTIVQLKEVMEHRTTTTKRDLNLDLLLLYQRRSGHLRGGGNDDDNNHKETSAPNELDDTTIEQYLQRQYASSTESITVRALSRIACWLLDVPIHPVAATTTTTSSTSCRDNRPLECVDEVGSILSYDDDDDDDETRSDCSYDNHDTISGSRFRTSTDASDDPGNVATTIPDHDNDGRYYPPVGHGLSSQAEAYYALGAVYRHILAESTPNMTSSEMTRRRSDTLDDIDRLDYEITQMDIVRMNRIASRHLDVESIVRLPVLTYQETTTNSAGPSNSNNAKATSGISPIPEDHEPHGTSSRSESRGSVDNFTNRHLNTEEGQQQHDAEFSWMLVPPTQDDGDDEGSMTQCTSDNGCNNSFESRKPAQEQKQEWHKSLKADVTCKNDACVICLESFIAGDRLRVLPCTHSFHVGCIDRWLSGSHSFYDCYTAGCPTCKVRPDATATTSSGNGVNDNDPNNHTSTTSLSALPQLHESDGSVPSWALARIGQILAHEPQHF